MNEAHSSSDDPPEHGHVPVMVPRVLEHLGPQPGESVLDATLGRGGHGEADEKRDDTVAEVGLESHTGRTGRARKIVRSIGAPGPRSTETAPLRR